MTGKPEILFLAHRIPYPPDKGDKIRSWQLFRHLTKRFSVHLACFVDDKRDLQYTDYLRHMCVSAAFVRIEPGFARLRSVSGIFTGEPLSFPYYRDREMLREVAKMRARPLAAEVVFSSSMAPYIETPIAGRKRIVDFCDADSEKWTQYGAQTPGPFGWMYRREGRVLARAESKIVNWADASFAITEEEAAIFNQRNAIKGGVSWWSNGVDAKYFDPAAAAPNIEYACDVIFTGAMDYRANIDAIDYFVKDVWPKVRAQAPEARFAIVGANPVKKIKMLDGVSGITVTGRVDDIRPWLQCAKAVVAPLRIARGVQNKVLEAMAMAKAVVATPEAAAGVMATHDADIVIAREPSEMADALVTLCNDMQERQRLGKAARATVLSHYDWDTQLLRFDEALKGIIVGGYASLSLDRSSETPPSD